MPSELEKAAARLTEVQESKPQANTPDTPPPAPRKTIPYVMIGKGEDATLKAAEERTRLLLANTGTLNMAEIEFALYLDPVVVKAETSVFTGPDFPYVFRWVTMMQDSYSSQLRNQAITRGYRPVDIREERFQDKLTLGRDALLLGIDRSTVMLQSYRATKTPVPAPLPDQLKDRWGMMLPPIVNADGRVIVGQRMLFYTEKEAVNARREAQRKAELSRVINKTDANFLAAEVGNAERPWEFPIPD